MQFLWRYTELPFLLHLLKTKHLTLLTPNTWDDQNDSFYIDLYRKKKGFKSVLVLCFTEIRETYHHWNVFSGSRAGISISFYKSKLVSWADDQGLRHASVEYYNNKELRKNKPKLDSLPFIKRKAYQDEKEFRLLYEDKNNNYLFKDFEFEPNIMIRNIRINPWLPKSIADSIKSTIKSIDGCESIEVIRTTLLENDQWKKIGETIV